jgi:hypothetical protein
VAHRDRLTLSEDDNMLTILTTVPQNHAFVFNRTAGRSGLVGKWQLKQVTQNDEIYEFVADGSDGMIIKMPQATTRVKFDGKDYPLTGPNMPAQITYAVTETDTRSFAVIQKQNGKVLVTISYRVSEDGKTLTALIRRADADPKQPAIKQVFDRQ